MWVNVLETESCHNANFMLVTAPEVVALTTSGTAIDATIGIKTIDGFQCNRLYYHFSMLIYIFNRVIG